MDATCLPAIANLTTPRPNYRPQFTSVPLFSPYSFITGEWWMGRQRYRKNRQWWREGKRNWINRERTSAHFGRHPDLTGKSFQLFNCLIHQVYYYRTWSYSSYFRCSKCTSLVECVGPGILGFSRNDRILMWDGTIYIVWHRLIYQICTPCTTQS